MLAPKLSVLDMAFSRKDLSVIALYMKTCGGVPDHAAEISRQVAKHGLAYPVLDAEGGPLHDPTRKRFPWAPHALVVDGDGRVIHTYGHLPRMKTLREDLRAIVATGLAPSRPDDAWREFTRRAWVDVRIEGREAPRNERRTLKAVSYDGVTIQRGEKEEELFREHLDYTDTEFRRTERETETFSVDGREVTARVFEAAWKREDVRFTKRSWIAQGVLLRRETVETSPDGSRLQRTYRLLRWNDPLPVGDRKLDCRVVERITIWKSGRTEEKVWLSEAVPGHEVKRVQKTVSHGEQSTETSTVVAFGLR